MLPPPQIPRVRHHRVQELRLGFGRQCRRQRSSLHHFLQPPLANPEYRNFAYVEKCAAARERSGPAKEHNAHAHGRHHHNSLTGQVFAARSEYARPPFRSFDLPPGGNTSPPPPEVCVPFRLGGGVPPTPHALASGVRRARAAPPALVRRLSAEPTVKALTPHVCVCRNVQPSRATTSRPSMAGGDTSSTSRIPGAPLPPRSCSGSS